jgi:hypothetical protein
MADGYEATHAVPPTGLPAWPVPDGTGPPAAALDPGLDVEVFERRADWAHIRCSNGWEAWIDGRDLVALQSVVPVAPPPSPEPVPVTVPEPHVDAPVPQPEPHADAPVPVPGPQADAPVPVAPEPHADAPVPAPVAATAPAAPTAAAPAAYPDPWAAGAVGPSRRLELGVPHVLVIVGSVLAAIATLLPWLEISSTKLDAFDAPLKFLREGSMADGGVKIGVVVVALAVLGIASVFVRPVRWFAIVTGVVIVGIGARFVMEVGTLLDELEQSRIFEDRFDVLQYGTYLAIAGGLLAIVGGALALRKPR